MLRNLKIGTRVGIGFFAIIAIAVLCVVLGLGGLRRTNNAYSDLLAGANQRVQILMQIPTDVANLRRLATTISWRTGQPELIAAPEQEMNQVHIRLLGFLEDFRANVNADNTLSPTARNNYLQSANELEELINYYIREISIPLTAAAILGDEETVATFGFAGVPIVAQMTEIYSTIISDAQAFMYNTTIRLNASANTTRRAIMIFSLTCVAIGIVVVIIITKSVSAPINKMLKLVNDVSRGKLDFNKEQNLPKDEIGTLTNDIYSLVDVIKNMVNDLSNVHTEYIKLGNIHYNIDDNRYQNSFKEMIGLVNGLLSQVTTDILEVADALGYISNGDFYKSINEEAWVGDWKAIPKALSNLTIVNP